MQRAKKEEGVVEEKMAEEKSGVDGEKGEKEPEKRVF